MQNIVNIAKHYILNAFSVFVMFDIRKKNFFATLLLFSVQMYIHSVILLKDYSPKNENSVISVISVTKQIFVGKQTKVGKINTIRVNWG